MALQSITEKAARWRRIVSVGAVILLSLASVSCCARLAWLWQATELSGGGLSYSVLVQHGALVINRTAGPSPPQSGSGMIFNRQLDPGINFKLIHRNVMTFPMQGGAMVSNQTLVVSIWIPLSISAIALWLWQWRMARRRTAGQCRCGYDLRGLPSKRCPECGTVTTC